MSKKSRATKIITDKPEVTTEWDKQLLNVVSKNTKSHLTDLWLKNLKENYDNGLWKAHKPLIYDCLGIGRNKCVVGIGAGQSFNKNKDVLRDHLNRDGIKNWEERAYITICANHQYKPLLKMGIIPDFVMLVDASDVVYDQLCKDIPLMGQSTVLITGMHCSPKVLKEWTNQGRSIRFFLNAQETIREEFRVLTGEDDSRHFLELGGNVINGAWIVGIMKFGSTVFMCVGNDLAYNDCPDVEQRKKEYYADGDYSTNDKATGTGRDEASKMKKWAGFRLEKRRIVVADDKDPLRRYNIELDMMGTTHTLWVYKVWLEGTLMQQAAHNHNSFHYFNCTEGGILGVLARSKKSEDMSKPTNWYMLDEVCRFYHTAMLSDAMQYFEGCREIFLWQKQQGVRSAGGLVLPN